MSTPLNYEMSPYEQAVAARAVAAICARRTHNYIWRAVDTAMHSDTAGIWNEARSQPGHEGSPALEIDVRAHQLMHDTVSGLVDEGPVIFDSEEGSLAYIPRAGAIKVIVDPLDGTGNARRLGCGYAVAILLGRLSVDEHFEPLAAAVATLGWVVEWMHLGPGAGEVFLGSQTLGVGLGPGEALPLRDDTDRLTWLSRIVPGDPHTVALVAASRARRELVEERFAFTGPTYNIAGNPLLPKLLRGGLAAIVEIKEVALRDAIFLLAHQRLGGLVTDIEGNEIDVYATFCQASRIGPFIAATSEQALAYVLGARR